MEALSGKALYKACMDDKECKASMMNPGPYIVESLERAIREQEKEIEKAMEDIKGVKDGTKKSDDKLKDKVDEVVTRETDLIIDQFDEEQGSNSRVPT